MPLNKHLAFIDGSKRKYSHAGILHTNLGFSLVSLHTMSYANIACLVKGQFDK